MAGLSRNHLPVVYAPPAHFCNQVAFFHTAPYHRSMQAAPTRHDQATRLLHQRGATVTPARVRVLQLLLAADAAMSHQSLQQVAAASGHPFDKVTLYRVLDWLTAHGLVHSVTGHDRVRRFSLMNPHHAHAHFECSVCGRLFCLRGSLATAALELPPGFASDRVDITVHGRCAGCAAVATAPRSRGKDPGV